MLQVENKRRNECRGAAPTLLEARPESPTSIGQNDRQDNGGDRESAQAALILTTSTDIILLPDRFRRDVSLLFSDYHQTRGG
ncbi:hypothetical protein [Caballeronia sp. dw_276]|uniref:hypothetical protein n=1 Tax=Caballeronia sp. dw_276 TaxID=2719795 RepID=UPI001BD4CDC6|nr:hypothetical protein [Caballeronia sp. dw_276]